MHRSTANPLAAALAELDTGNPDYATEAVQRILAAARAAGASDLHLLPTGSGLELRLRIDGVMRQGACVPSGPGGNVVARLKVRAGLLTYQSDTPQEGRIALPEDDVEMRVSTFPTLHGEKAVVRLFGGMGHFRQLSDLGLHDDLRPRLTQLLGETSGAVIISGPAGSGKTTTGYACLRELAAASDVLRSLVSLEDPIEVPVEGVAQSQVNPRVGFDLATGLRFLMRQDPEVIMVGEIRDRPTAEAAMQASLSGHLLLSTFHAGSAAETLGRLLDMGVEPYVVRSGLLAILSQRLLRRLCPCARESRDPDDLLGLPVRRAGVPAGCPGCSGSGYRGRFLLAEMLELDAEPVARAVLARRETAVLERVAIEAGMVPQWQRALEAVEHGRTSPAEIRRTMGFSNAPASEDREANP